jgi:hypothetical protein
MIRGYGLVKIRYLNLLYLLEPFVSSVTQDSQPDLEIRFPPSLVREPYCQLGILMFVVHSCSFVTPVRNCLPFEVTLFGLEATDVIEENWCRVLKGQQTNLSGKNMPIDKIIIRAFALWVLRCYKKVIVLQLILPHSAAFADCCPVGNK